MTSWRDGMGRITVKADTGSWARGSLIMRENGPCGFCRAVGWIQVYGPCVVKAIGINADEVRQDQRERLAMRARRQRLGSRERYDPLSDPRLAVTRRRSHDL